MRACPPCVLNLARSALLWGKQSWGIGHILSSTVFCSAPTVRVHPCLALSLCLVLAQVCLCPAQDLAQMQKRWPRASLLCKSWGPSREVRTNIFKDPVEKEQGADTTRGKGNKSKKRKALKLE